MVTAPPKPQKVRPWDAYRSEGAEYGPDRLRYKLLQPGWGGHLDPDELAYIVEHLYRDSDLRKWWGMKPSWQRIPEQAVLRIACELRWKFLRTTRPLTAGWPGPPPSAVA
jgi:hypothetical protein